MDLLPLETVDIAPAAGSVRAESLRVMPPNVTRDEAIAILAPSRLRGLPWMPGVRPLRSVAEFYIPFQLFRLQICHGASRDERCMAIDLVSGLFDPFEFPQVPTGRTFVEINSRNRMPPVLSTHDACAMLHTKMQRLMFQSGFFRVGYLQIQLEPLGGFHMPYWIGFFGSGESTSIEVLDAIRRRKEGAKLRKIVTEWLVRPWGLHS